MTRKTHRKTKRSILTPEQREEYHDELEMGVPEDVIEEWIASLDQYIAEWKAKVKAHVKKSARKAR